MEELEFRRLQHSLEPENFVHQEMGSSFQQHPIEEVDLEPEGHGFCGWFIIVLAVIFSILLFPVALFFMFRLLKTYERGVVLRLGKLSRSRTQPIRGSGIVCLIPFVDKLYMVDTRTRTVNIPPQEILTKDSVTVRVDAVVYMHVVDTALALLRVENWSASAELLATSMVRKILGKYKFSELLTSRDEIDRYMKSLIDHATDAWGIKVERVEITDVVLPMELQRAMASQAEETCGSKAKVIAAQGELESAHMLRQAAEQLSITPTAFQLRLLQTMTTISAEQNSTIIFPFPVEFLNLFKKD